MQLFLPCILPSGYGSPSVSSAGFATHPGASQVDIPRTVIAHVPDGSRQGSSSGQLTYDDFCSSESQRIWTGGPQLDRVWVLKVCRYGEQLVAVLADRSNPGRFKTWSADRFSYLMNNMLHSEGDEGSIATVRPA